MDMDSVLCQLMGIRVNGVLNRIVEADADYQEIVRKSGEYSGRLDALELPEEVRLLIGPVCQRTERTRRPLRRTGLPAWLFRLRGADGKAAAPFGNAKESRLNNAKQARSMIKMPRACFSVFRYSVTLSLHSLNSPIHCVRSGRISAAPTWTRLRRLPHPRW